VPVLKFIGPVLVNAARFLNVPLLTLMVPLLLHEDVNIVLVPVPVCLVSVPVFINAALFVSELFPFMVMVPVFVIAPVPVTLPSFQVNVPLLVNEALKALPLLVFKVRVPVALITAVPVAPKVPLEICMSPFTSRSVPMPSLRVSVLVKLKIPPASTTIWSAVAGAFTVIVCVFLILMAPSVLEGATAAATQVVPSKRSQLAIALQLPVAALR